MSLLFKTILSLFDYSGAWSKPYKDNGYQVIRIDIQRGKDVRLLKYPGRVHGILMAPPCTHFAASGSQYWKSKGDRALLEGLQLVDAGLRFVSVCKPVWWVLENPVGRLKDYLGPYKLSFDPWEFAKWADDPSSESYTKQTCLWGNFKKPERRPLKPSIKDFILSQSKGNARTQTPQGFARAFFEANP